MLVTDPVAPVIDTIASEADNVSIPTPPAPDSSAPQIGPSSLSALAGVSAAPAVATTTPPPTPTPVPATPATINSGNTAPVTPLTPATPAPTGIYPVTALNPDVPTGAATLTPEENSAQSLSDSLEGLNNLMSGKAADQSAADTAAGVDSDNATINDLSAQLKGLQNEASAIPIQLQTDANGRGITAGGLAPIQSAQLRNNATQALTISTLLQAAQGNLANAQAQADKVVASKYDPIQAKITAATANLKLIQDSPEYTTEEKNQAQAQLDIQNQKQAALDQAKADTASILSIAQTAAANGADAVTLQKITQATTPAAALAISAGAGFASKAADVTTSTVNVGGRTLLINSKTGATIKDLGASSSTAAQTASSGIAQIQNSLTPQSTFVGTNINGKAQTFNVLQGNGTFSVEGFKAAIADAPSVGLTRDDFLNAFGSYLIDPATGTISKAYGLTPAEAKKIGATISTN